MPTTERVMREGVPNLNKIRPTEVKGKSPAFKMAAIVPLFRPRSGGGGQGKIAGF